MRAFSLKLQREANLAFGSVFLGAGVAGPPFAPLLLLGMLGVCISGYVTLRRSHSPVVIAGATFLLALMTADFQHFTFSPMMLVSSAALAALAIVPPPEMNRAPLRIYALAAATIATIALALWKPAAAVGLIALAVGLRSARSDDLALLYGALTGTSLFFFG